MNLVVNKKVLYIAIALGYIIMGITIVIGFNRIQNLKNENQIISDNFLNSKFEIDSIKNKNDFSFLYIFFLVLVLLLRI